jgi:integrase
MAPFTVHDFRRTVNTHMSGLGMDVQTRARVLNHVSTLKGSITENVYNASELEREKRQALETWAAELQKIIGGGEPASNIINIRDIT